MRMLRLLTAVVVAALVAAAQENKPVITEKHYRIFRGDGQAATLDDVVSAAATATVTFLGESHGDPVGHYLEEQILRSVYAPELALSLEMFETDTQAIVDEYLAGLITEDHLVASGRAWRNYKSDYRPLVEFAKERKMPVIAANPPRRYVNRVSRLGAAALADLNAETRRFLPPLPFAEASPAYAKKFHKIMEEGRRAQEKQAAESKQPALDPIKGLQAQSLWDAGMAYSIAAFLTRNPGMRILHCNGSFHSAGKLGIPDHLSRYRPGTSMIVITMMPDSKFPEFDMEKMRGEGDFVIVTDPKARPTPNAIK